MCLMDANTVESCGVDVISSFPDEILALILSFLPTKRAASTTILSKRWRNLFPLMKKLFSSHHVFCLDNTDLVYPKEEKLKDVQNKRFKDFVDKTLSGSDSIKKIFLKPQQDSLDRYTRRICNLLRGIDEDDTFFCIPRSVFTSKMLVKLTLEGVEPKHIHEVFLPALKSLVLHDQPFFWGKQLCHEILRGCPILEELFLHHSYISKINEVEPFSISHKTLKRLTVVHKGQTLDHGRSISFDTPSLVYLDYSAPGPHPNITASFLDSLVQAKLNVKYGGCKDLSEVVNLMRNVKTLSVSFTCIKVRNFYCKDLPIFVNLVELSFESNTIEGWEMLQRLLNNSPKLETLVMKACIISQSRQRNFYELMMYYSKVLHIFSNLVKLSFESNTIEGWEMLPRFLEKSPKLETLVLKGFHSIKNKRVCDCIDRKKIKVLEIYGFGGSVREFRQVKCFLKTMQFLQVMRVEIIADDIKKPRFITHLFHLPKRSSKCKVNLL